MPGLRLQHGPEQRRVQHDVLRGHTGPIQCLWRASGPDQALISGGSDGTIRIWDPARSSRAVQCLDMSGLNQSLNSVIALNDQYILLGADTHLYRLDRRRIDQGPVLVGTADDDINQISALNDEIVVWADDAGLLYIARVNPFTSELEMQIDPIQAHDNICTSVVIRPESSDSEATIYTAGMDCKIGVWDLE